MSGHNAFMLQRMAEAAHRRPADEANAGVQTAALLTERTIAKTAFIHEALTEGNR